MIKDLMSEIKNKYKNPLLSAEGRILSPSRVAPGPMEGIMSPLYCAVMEKMGFADYWITPFFRLSEACPRPARFAEWIAKYSGGGFPVVIQLMACRPEIAAEATSKILDLNLVCGIDLNFACPSKTVTGSGAGGAMLKNPAEIEKITSAVKKSCGSIPLSVKIRCGYQSPEESPEIVKAVLAGEADFIICHFRTVQEGFKPVEGGLSRLAKTVECAGKTPVVGSGDIFTPEDASAMFRETGCKGIIAARGLLANPALIRIIEADMSGEPRPDEKVLKLAYFENMVRIAVSDPEEYLRGASLKELAACLLGRTNPLFKRLAPMNPKETVAAAESLIAEARQMEYLDNK